MSKKTSPQPLFYNVADIVGVTGPKLGGAGSVVFANADMVNNTFMSQPLTDYAVGYRDDGNLEAALEILAPAVRTSRRFQFRKADNAAQFLGETDGSDERGLRGEFMAWKDVARSKAVALGLIEEDEQINAPDASLEPDKNDYQRAFETLSAEQQKNVLEWLEQYRT